MLLLLINEYYPLIILLIGSALLSGFLAGLLGVGGGSVVVPVVFFTLQYLGYTTGVSLSVAIAVSMANMIPTAIIAIYSHHLKNNFSFDLFKRFAIGMFIGSLLGAWSTRYLHFKLLLAIFILLLIFICFNLLKTKPFFIADKLPDSKIKTQVWAIFIAIISSLTGIGGGAISVPLLMGFTVPIRRAIGTSTAFVLVVAVSATIIHSTSGWSNPNLPPYSLGYVNWALLLLFIPCSVFAAPLGVKVATKLPMLWLKYAFVLFLIAVIIRLSRSLIYG